MDRSNEVIDALERLRTEVLEDSLELARRRRQLQHVSRLVVALDAQVLEVSGLLSDGVTERLA